VQVCWPGRVAIELKATAGTVMCDPFPEIFQRGAVVDPNTIVTISEASRPERLPEGIPAAARVISGPGEYEIKGIGIRGVPIPRQDPDDQRAVNTAYVVEADGMAFCHLGVPSGELSPQALRSIGRVDVLIVPIDGDLLSPEQAVAAVRQVEPGVVIPVGFEPAEQGTAPSLTRFISELGVEAAPPVGRISIVRNSIGEDLKIVVLTPQLP